MTHQNISDLLDSGYTAIKQKDGQFEAFIVGRGMTYRLGPFTTQEEAERAIDDATKAQWNG